MKKLFFFLSLFMFIGVVNAKEITLDEMVDTINNGIITKEVIKLELATMNGDKPKWEEVIINAVRKDNCIDIALIYVGEEGIMGNVNACLLEDGKTLQSIIRYHEDDKDDDNYLGLMSSYFDKCYREEMHACRTYISNYGNYEYTSDVELNEEAAKYVIKRLKEDKRVEDNKNMLYIIFLVGVGIAVLFVIAKMCEPKAKPIKY